MKKLFGALVFLFLPAFSHAQSVVKATSCLQADVNAVINGPLHIAANGDTIQVPAGTCTWTIPLNISVGITLIGSGTPNTLPSQFGSGTLNTTILSNTGNSGAMIQGTLALGQTLRISSLVIKPVTTTTTLFSPISVNGTCTSSGCPLLRVDNLNFSGWNSVGGANGFNSAWMVRTDNVYGVMDHNSDTASSGSVALANSDNSAWLGTGKFGDNSWAQPDSYGTNQQMVFENNSLGSVTQDCDLGGGCRISVRFNQFPNASTGMAYFHGTESSQRERGGRQAEIYGNDYHCPAAACDVMGIDLRSGTALFFGNSISGGGNTVIKLDDYRTQNSFALWGACDGRGQWDKNDGTAYASGTFTSVSGTTVTDSNKSWTANQWTPSGEPYSLVDTSTGWGIEIQANGTDTITYSNALASTYGNSLAAHVGDSYQILRAQYCIDQPARSGGALLSGSTPSAGWVNQILDPIYEFADSISATIYGSSNIISSDTGKLISNRDFYEESKNQSAQTSPTFPFNGTSGTGHGTLANRPTTCSAGVGYFATDQGNWNSSSNGFGQGILYLCTATNAWSQHYQPYTYPHPLIAGGSLGSGNGPLAPTNLTLTVQ